MGCWLHVVALHVKNGTPGPECRTPEWLATQAPQRRPNSPKSKNATSKSHDFVSAASRTNYGVEKQVVRLVTHIPIQSSQATCKLKSEFKRKERIATHVRACQITCRNSKGDRSKNINKTGTLTLVSTGIVIKDRMERTHPGSLLTCTQRKLYERGGSHGHQNGAETHPTRSVPESNGKQQHAGAKLTVERSAIDHCMVESK